MHTPRVLQRHHAPRLHSQLRHHGIWLIVQPPVLRIGLRRQPQRQSLLQQWGRIGLLRRLLATQSLHHTPRHPRRLHCQLRHHRVRCHLHPQSCATGYVGNPTGSLACSNGAISGSFAGCSLPASCSATVPQGYVANCGTIASGATCSPQSCATDYVGNPTGSLACSNGQVSGSFAGCTVPASCASPTVPAAYIANCGTIASGVCLYIIFVMYVSARRPVRSNAVTFRPVYKVGDCTEVKNA